MSVYRHQGRWMFDFIKGKVRHKKSGFPTKQEAKNAEVDARRNLKGMNLDFIALCESRLKWLKTRTTQKHFVENKLLIEKLVVRWGKQKGVTRDDIKDFLDETAARSHSNANAQLKMIKALFNHGIEEDLINISPAAKITRYSVDRKRKYIPPQKHIQKVLDVAEPMDRLYLLVVAHTLGRITAVNRLKWEDIHKKYLSLYTRKSRSSDLKEIIVPINKVLREVLKQIPRVGEFVFINPKTGKPYEYRKRLLRGLCKKAKVKYFSFHCIRHFGASKLANKRAALTDIQRILGHEKATTTDIYLQSLKGSASKVIKKLEDLS
jgi:integrase